MSESYFFIGFIAGCGYFYFNNRNKLLTYNDRYVLQESGNAYKRHKVFKLRVESVISSICGTVGDHDEQLDYKVINGHLYDIPVRPSDVGYDKITIYYEGGDSDEFNKDECITFDFVPPPPVKMLSVDNWESD